MSEHRTIIGPADVDHHDHRDDDYDVDDLIHAYNASTRLWADGRYLVTTASDGRHVIRCRNGEVFVSRSSWAIYRTYESLSAGGGLLARLTNLPLVRVAGNANGTIVEFPIERFPRMLEMLGAMPAPDSPRANVGGLTR